MRKILILEDDPDTLDALTEQLQRESYQVFPCASPTVALAQLHGGPNPDLILADTMMTGNGRGLAATLKADPRFSAIPLLLMSASSKVTREDIEHVGAVGFLRKPFDLDDLFGTISRIIAQTGEQAS